MNKTRNWQLYARILHLMTEDHESIRHRNGYDECYKIMHDVIATDRDLVWC